MLHLQEGRIEILRAVTEKVKERHDQHQIQTQLPLLAQNRKQRGILFTRSGRQPDGGFRHFKPDIRQQDNRQSANQEHAAPAYHTVEEAKNNRGEQIAAGIARLKNARHQATRTIGNGFHRQ
ncbi:Uncharacterised protein [Salmonella enterica subsp. enterica serovar Bovismorbificans]|nr:Uncharacterised protein [Salmonella enterica subsp. enterica serovar Bovismorbificans]